MGIEVCHRRWPCPVWAAICFWATASFFWVVLYAMSTHAIPAVNNMTSIETTIFHIVGIGSIIAGVWLSLKPGESLPNGRPSFSWEFSGCSEFRFIFMNRSPA